MVNNKTLEEMEIKKGDDKNLRNKVLEIINNTQNPKEGPYYCLLCENKGCKNVNHWYPFKLWAAIDYLLKEVEEKKR